MLYPSSDQTQRYHSVDVHWGAVTLAPSGRAQVCYTAGKGSITRIELLPAESANVLVDWRIGRHEVTRDQNQI